MFDFTTPQAVGFSEKAIQDFMRALNHGKLNLHSMLLAKGDHIFYERYWEPYDETRIHRMYSVTKSFVSIAIGCLLDEGKLSLDDPIIQYFPDKLPEDIDPLMQKQTIRHMLMMSTAHASGVNQYWFQPGVTDRTAYYFSLKASKPAGSLFDYDSNGSYVLGALVERLSGMPLLEYLKLKVLNRIGGFEDAQMLQTPDGTAWGDSALLCTPRALMNFAKFVMNGGVWEGERLVSEAYMREAVSCQTTNDFTATETRSNHGYGYQIWLNERDGFSFHGMGGQFAICLPEEDFILVCTADNQYNAFASEKLFRALFDILLPKDVPVEDVPGLRVANGEAHSDFAALISGKEFVCRPNPMGITRFRLDFSGDEGCFVYENAQGLKSLPFGMKRNVYGKFPQLGYSDQFGNIHEPTGFLYDCAASAGWIEPQKLQLRVQIIDRYFGSMFATFGFVDENTVGLRMIKNAEDFLSEYDGWASCACTQLLPRCN